MRGVLNRGVGFEFRCSSGLTQPNPINKKMRS